MLPTTIRAGSPLLAVTSATATAAVPTPPASPHLVPSLPGDASGRGEALQSQERAAANDPKYRKYAAAVEKTLATFEHVNEWADFITFLAKLLKCLQSAPQYPFIPHKLTVAKRLSQCLNPALPTGVHQRALDVYTHILTTIGPDNLRRDLPAWTSGLLPFFQYAATSIKPMVLSILDRFYLPLQDALRPATKAFILALLPGLDEEAGEWFEQVAALLDRLCATVTPAFFLPTLWLVLITAPRSRVAALNYLSRRLPLLAPPAAAGSPAEQPDRQVGLMVRAFAAALVDEQILVQRGVLDLLISTLPVHSTAYQGLPQADRTLLARASLGVVLRRDLSLTRRLYTWLLGRSDGSDDQIEYFRSHALRDVHAALICDMDAAATISSSSDTPSAGDAEATTRATVTAAETARPNLCASTSSAILLRPFKIFISLLDKWELGAPLTAVAAIDTFAAIRSILSPRDGADVNDEFFLTAQLLYEAFDPTVLWRAVYDIIQRALQDEDAPAAASISQLALVRYVVSTFRIRDGEAKALHAPLIAVSTLRAVTARLETVPSLAGLAACVEVAQDLIAEIPAAAPTEYASASARAETGSAIGAVEAAQRIYTAMGTAQEATMTSLSTPDLLSEGLVTALDLIASSCRMQCEDNEATSGRTVESRKVCLLATRLVRRLFRISGLLARDCDSSVSSTGAPWSASAWIRDVASAVESVRAVSGNFELHEALIRSVLDLHAESQLTSAAQRIELTKVFSTKLLDYLAATSVQCHLTAVELIWTVGALSPLRTVETIVASRLESRDKLARARGYEEFGNLWRFTPDQQLPGRLLRLPMFAILDGLKSDSLTERRLAEAWMRCSLKSYIRVLDPIFYILTDPSLRIETRVEKLGDIRVPISRYPQPIDHKQIQHALDSLLSLARFGGQGFIRVAKTSFLKHTLDPSFRQQILHTELETCTYLDGLVALLLRFLCAETAPPSRVDAGGSQVHAVTAEILQVLLSRGESELSDIPTIEAALSSRLFISVDRGEIDLQNKMLHVLHTVVHARSQLVEPPRGPGRRERAETSASLSHSPPGPSSAAPRTPYSPPDLSRDEFFLRIVTRALEQDDNAVVHHWLDFLLMTVPHSHYDDVVVLDSLLDVLILRLGRCVAGIELAFGRAVREADAGASDAGATDAEFAAIVNALERLLLLYMPKIDREATGSLENSATQRSGGDPGAASGPAALLGYVTGVLGQADTDPDRPSASARRDTRCFVDAVAVLLVAWDSSLRLEKSDADVFHEARDHVVTRIRIRARRALDRLIKSNTADIADAVVHVWADWQAGRRLLPANASRAGDNLPGILHTLFPSPATFVRALYEGVPVKHSANKSTSSDRSSATDGESTLAFLDFYLGHIEPASIVQLWNPTIQFAREMVANQNHNRNLLYPTLRCFVTVADKLAQTRALEDRRLRRELQEMLSRLIDVTTQMAARTPDSTGWLRKTTRETSAVAEDEASISNETDASSITEKERSFGADMQKSFGVNELSSFLATSVFPLLTSLQLESDKVAAICTNISYYVLAPAVKARSQHSEMSPAVYQLLTQMTHQVGAAKVWKGVVSDGFSDHRFFQASPSAHRYWRPLVHALMSADRDRIPELVAKVSTSSSANIFTNRELEVLSRALALRRVTYTLFCSPKDTFLTQLPVIQEKLVDLLRSPVGDLVQAEVYLCLRVLFCRIDNQHLAGLWPVILTELLRLFDSLLDRSVSDGSDLLQLVSAACKFLDLTLVLQTEDFQIHEWIFVTDTIDAAGSTCSMPQAVIDRLGARTSGATILEGNETLSSPDTSARRPLLTARRISSMSTLQPFLQNVSRAAYDSICDAGTKIDWAAVEGSLVADLFEGPSDSPVPS